jgi:hypothetical protein
MKRVPLVLLAALFFLFFPGAACTNGTAPARDAAVIDLAGGLAGFALDFDGVQSYATAGDAAFPAAGDDQTIELWFEAAATTEVEDFIVLRQDFDNGVQLGVRDGAITVWTTYAHTILAAAPTFPAPGAWHHVAYTHDASQKLYLDGELVATSTATSDKRTPTSAWLGTVDGAAELFKGRLDEVRVWTVARSASDILADMLHSTGQGESGLVAYWTFDDTSATACCRDSSGLGNDVTLGDGIAARMPARVASDAPVER